MFDDVTRENRNEKSRRRANAIGETHQNARVRSADVQMIDAETCPSRSTTSDRHDDAKNDPKAMFTVQQRGQKQRQGDGNQRWKNSLNERIETSRDERLTNRHDQFANVAGRMILS